MSNQKRDDFPTQGPHRTGPDAAEDYSDPIEQEVEEKFTKTPGPETVQPDEDPAAHGEANTEDGPAHRTL